MYRFLGSGMLVVALATTAHAQTFTSGSLGTDGALALTTPGTVDFDPVALGIDPDGDLVFHFTTITIGPGVTVRFTAQRLGGPVVWLASGDVQIDGILDLNGENGQSDLEVAEESARRAIAGAGGFGGGLGGRSDTDLPQPGLGPGGGLPSGPLGGAAGNASHAIQAQHAGPTYGNDFLVPLVGGSGGSGGYFSGLLAYGTGGGAGGGAILVASSTSIAVAGAIQANGGARGAAQFTANQFGGAGSGGSIHLMAPLVTVDGALAAAGGTPGAQFPLSAASPGRIRVEAVVRQLAGATIQPTPTSATAFGQPLLQTARPTLRVTSIIDQSGTQLVQDPPSASFALPDVSIDDSGPVTVNIEAENIPVGTVVQLHVLSETGSNQIVDSTALAGTDAASSATATVTLPAGFSRGFVRSVFTPAAP